MKQHKIRTSKTDSIMSVSRDNFVDVNLKQTTKLMPYNDIKETIDQREIFENERRSCNQYRLILTINPYCTNVLFNTLTEIVKNEGSGKDIKVITDVEETVNEDGIMGKKGNLIRNDMIMNTEYSKEEINYEYHPGYDIFNNHIMRNITFKMVNKPSGNNLDEFNTIGDFLRDKDGAVIRFKKRQTINKITDYLDKHLYLADDVLTFKNGDAINNNLREDNGWFGFINNSTISAKERKNKTDSEWYDMDVSRVLNNRKNCEFIDMYPDRTLYSFNPKYNSFRHRPEYNWNVCITYPYRNDFSHPILSNKSNGDGKTNALQIMSITKVNGLNDDDVLLVRTFSKHGLKMGDNIYFYYSKDGGASYEKSEVTYKLTNTGDLNKNNKDYYFYITDLNLIHNVLGGASWYDEYGNNVKTNDEINAELKNIDFRFAHVVNGVESQYYMRIFRKLPNFRRKKENLEQEIAENTSDFMEYVVNNCVEDDMSMIDFNKEQYQLAFSSTIYNDNNTQITFTDGLNIEHLVDNLGRPLTDLYVTIVKNNAGNTLWYSDADYTNSSVEYSHCFGPIKSGLYYHTEESDRGGTLLNKRGNMSDIRVINESEYYSSKPLEEYIDLFDIDNANGKKYEKNIVGVKYTDNEFIGDLVEFIPCKAQEVVLDDVYHRFNTAQRELNAVNGDKEKYKTFHYQEIAADDYDLDDFTVADYILTDNINRPEGYYYKAHYGFSVRNFGDIQQAAHFDIKVKSATPIQLDGMYVKITSSLNSGVAVNDIIYICDDALGKWYKSNVIYVIDTHNFVISPISDINWIKLCDILNADEENKKFKVRRKNIDIPNYATKIGNNKFLWRNVVRNGDIDSTVPEYIFANGYFYINKDINFFLKRQDPHDNNGLYLLSKNIFPNDVYGMVKPVDKYIYKEESEIIC